MKRYNIRLPTTLFETLKSQAKRQDRKLSDYCRHLLEVGLQLEQLSEEKSMTNTEQGKSDSELALDHNQELWEKSLTWTLENRFLLRSLVDRLLDQSKASNHALLAKSQRVAVEYIGKLFDK